LEWKYPLTKYVYRPISKPIALALARNGVSPNIVTAFTAAVGLLAAGLYGARLYELAIPFTLITMIWDCVDGDLARQQNSVTLYGNFLDSTLDRVIDAAIILGITLSQPVILSLPASFLLSGMFMVSYVRTKAEAVGAQCEVGLATRDIRLLIVLVAVIIELFWSGSLYVGFVGLAALSWLTAAHRIIFVVRQLRAR
jgi:CDP-diacylglycerol--glycerol-3-phosphate 3-phosphatidyltransferase